MIRILNNDPFGDDDRYGPVLGFIVHLLRMLKVMVLGIAMLSGGLIILIVGGMIVKLFLMGFGLFVTDIPFEHRL